MAIDDIHWMDYINPNHFGCDGAIYPIISGTTQITYDAYMKVQAEMNEIIKKQQIEIIELKLQVAELQKENDTLNSIVSE